MPRKKSVSQNVVFPQMRSLNSYTSLMYGIISVFVLFLIVVFAFKVLSNRDKAEVPDQGANISETLDKAQDKNSYTVQVGDSLWSISEKVYSSGFEWKRIADANNVSNPSLLSVGVKLSIPEIPESEKSKLAQAMASPTVTSAPVPTATLGVATQSKIEGSTYTVVHGDTLWDVAVRAYGDGYKWVDIAKANSLANPDVIHAGNQFTIPR